MGSTQQLLPQSALPDRPGEEVLLKEVLASPHFQRAPALSRLLVYLWEHRAQRPTEYSIGVDVFGKPADFDPKLDATIRVHVSRLRQKLRDYAQSLPPDQPLRLSLPSGSLKPQVAIMKSPANAIATEPLVVPALALSPGTALYRRLTFALGAITLCLLAGLIAVSVQLARADRAASSVAGLPPLWQRVLGNGRLTRIVFPTPVFLSSGPLRVRDVTVNDGDDIGSSMELRRLSLLSPAPTLSHSYSVTSDTLALGALLPVLSNRGFPVAVNSTRTFSLERFGSDNLLFLGIPPTSPHIARLLAGNHFYIEPRASQVRIRNPSAEESRVSLASTFDGSRGLGIVAVIPGETAGVRVVLLCGLHSDALAAYLASPVTLREFEAFLATQGTPEFFEMLLETRQEGPNLLKARPVAFRAVRPTH